MTLSNLIRRSVVSSVELVRRGGRPVVWTPEWMGFGNVLYVLHWVQTARRRGIAMWARQTPVLTPWLDIFPELQQFVIPAEEIRFTDRRLMPFSQAGRAALPEGLYDRVKPLRPEAPFEDFIRTCLLPGVTRRDPQPPPADSQTVIVNVRRGDYYSNPEHRAAYGFDVENYIDAALTRTVVLHGPIATIRLVSDDPEWCRRTLQLDQFAREVSSASVHEGPVENFFDVARAYRMVITNSTFSYWAAMVSNVRHANNHSQVVAPRFFDRSRDAGRSTLVDNRWTIIEDLPGGWDPPEDRAISTDDPGGSPAVPER